MGCLFFTQNSSYSKILKDEVIITGEEVFSFSYACKKNLGKDSALVDIKDIQTLDCMGKEVKVYDFCFKELESSPYYLRGLVSRERKKVVCKLGKSVSMKVTCDTAGIDCKDSEIACFNLKRKYAARLKLSHHSSFDQNNNKILNCHFGLQESLKLPK